MEKELVAQERRAYEHRPDWELRMVKKALGYHQWLNSPEEKARLVAIDQIFAERRKADRKAKKAK